MPTHDTSDYVFDEVYPPLPSTVKRINVSFGNYYCVENFK